MPSALHLRESPPESIELLVVFHGFWFMCFFFHFLFLFYFFAGARTAVLCSVRPASIPLPRLCLVSRHAPRWLSRDQVPAPPHPAALRHSANVLRPAACTPPQRPVPSHRRCRPSWMSITATRHWDPDQQRVDRARVTTMGHLVAATGAAVPAAVGAKACSAPHPRAAPSWPES